ncbi:hypothetical protein EEJ42_12245 [Streptomyces botrytidirepellens]|uniref:Uncharacterized protein n=1 Tax=Streptomyces botrytidirepellens TaxID=2486417 RepID=A0A3M8WHK9_9ACTN|nr:hypothetical protein EEJ42_12245 [Streptomyces botrytidirepellens]
MQVSNMLFVLFQEQATFLFRALGSTAPPLQVRWKARAELHDASPSSYTPWSSSANTQHAPLCRVAQ